MQQIIIGLGSGRCGTLSLAELLDQQDNATVTHECRPLLTWESQNRDRAARERLRRITQDNSTFVGDVGSFYLPYVDALMEQNDQIRFVCLKRPCEEVVRSFEKWVDRIHAVPTDHWRVNRSNGYLHHPVWSTIFPKYEADSREDAIRRYWTEYYQTAEELAERYPSGFRIFDMQEALNTDHGQREVLSFAGFPSEAQRLRSGVRTHESAAEPSVAESLAAQAEGAAALDEFDPRRCVILVPHGGQIISDCEKSLKVLEGRGYTVRRVSGYSQIDVGRNEIASRAILDGFRETMWIDSDVGFNPDAVEKLRRHNQPIICGIYPKKGPREFACSVLPGTQKLIFGEHGGLQEIRHAATGFLLVRREVYVDIQYKLGLPLCDEEFGKAIVPWFLPMVLPHREGHWYLGEDYAFSERARQAGYRIMADTSIRLWHIGSYRYGWEDAGRDVVRFANHTHHFTD